MPSQIDYSGKFDSPYDGNKAKRDEYRKINQSLSPVEKDRLHREMKDLEGKVGSSLMSKDDMWPVRNPDSTEQQENLTRKAHELLKREADPEYQRNYKRLKDIRMKLDPDDPEMGSPEYLRKGGKASQLAKWS